MTAMRVARSTDDLDLVHEAAMVSALRRLGRVLRELCTDVETLGEARVADVLGAFGITVADVERAAAADRQYVDGAIHTGWCLQAYEEGNLDHHERRHLEKFLVLDAAMNAWASTGDRL